MSIRYNSCKSGHSCGAFSLFELLITIAIFSILVSVSVPSWQRLLQRYYFTLRCDQLWHTLYYAKSMAILKGCQVMLCGSDNGRRCSGHWTQYWLIQDGLNHTIERRIRLASIKNFSLSWRGNFKNRDGIYFNRLGETGGQQGRFDLRLGTNHLQIVLMQSGRVRWNR